MNERFYRLPQKRQNQIINAAFRVFGESSYKKSPMSEVADAAGISKPLLFHYFENKKGLYFYLWQLVADLSHKSMGPAYDGGNLFEMMRKGLQLKLQILHKYPFLYAFILRAYYERDPEIAPEVKRRMAEILDESFQQVLSRLNPDDYLPGLDMKMVLEQMLYTADGYLRLKVMPGLLKGEPLDAEMMEKDFLRMVDFWEQVYGNRKNEPKREVQKDD